MKGIKRRLLEVTRLVSERVCPSAYFEGVSIRSSRTGSVDMYNAKNTYIVSTAVSNRLKARFYQVDLPSIHDVSASTRRSPYPPC